jgi:hypothetical protein
MTLTFKSITTALLVLFVWAVGSIELIDTFKNFSTEWYWYILAIIYTVTINDLFVHICLGHKIYPIDTNRIGYKILAFLATVDNAWGPISSMCLVHRNHHLYSDQGHRDVSNWRIHWYNMGILSPVNYLYQAKTEFPDQEKYFSKQQEMFKEILDDTWLWFIEEYSHIFTIMFWIVLYLLCPIVLFKIIFMGRVLMSVFTLFPGMFGHMWIPGGYRNFNTPDTSYNNLLLHYFCLGLFPTVLQNNHHGQMYTIEKGHGYRWFEVDLSKYMVRLIKKITEKIDG